ncbi:MAG: PAS domain S-box protein [Bacteroidetes bacterium]|nr:PAS domain S-box protein [Bacteroidota bacterium]
MSTWESLENKVFEQLSRNENINVVFDTMLTGLKQICTNMYCYVTKKREGEMELEWLSHPSISEKYINSIPSIPIDPLKGSCGLAAYSMQPVYISNIREFECWDNYRDNTLLQGFQACHSFPILRNDGMVLGTIGAYFKDIHDLSDFELSLFKRAVNVSSVILEKYSIENEVYLKSRQLEELGYSIPGVMYIVKMDNEGRRKFEFVSERIGEFMKISKQTALDSYSSVLSNLEEKDQVIFMEKLKYSLENRLPLNTEFRLRPEVNPEFHCFMLQSVHHFNKDGTVVTYGSIYDISPQKKVELELKKKQEEMLSLIKCLDDVVYVLNEDDVFIDVFAKDESLFFMDKSKIVGKKFTEIFENKVCDLYLNAKIELLENNESEKFYFDFIRNGEVVNFCSRLIQVNDTSQVVFTAKNFSSELKTMEVNKKLSKILEDAADFARFGTFEFDVSTNEVFWSKGMFDLLGLENKFSPSELFSKFLKIIHPDDVAPFESYMKNALEKGAGFEWDHRLKHVNGDYIWLQGKVKIDVADNGVPKSMKGICFDITKRKLAEVLTQRKNSLNEAISLLSKELYTDGEIIDSINLILPKIGEASQVNRIRIFRNSNVDTDGVLRAIHILEWNDGLFPSKLENDLLNNCNYTEIGFGRWLEVLGKGESIVGEVANFPKREQDVLLAQDILSMAVIPIFVGNKWWGFIGMEECRGARNWKSGVVELIQNISSLIGLALKRKQEYSILAENKAKYKAAFETMSEALVITDKNGIHINSNEAAKKLLGLIGKQKVGVCDTLKQNGNVLIHEDGTEFSEEEYPINRVTQRNEIVKDVVMGVKSSDGETRWISVNASPLYSFGNDHETTGIMLVISNVNEKISLARKLKESAELNDSLEKHIPNEIAYSLELTAQMLQLQKLFVTNENTQVVLDESASRIQTLKQLHIFQEKSNGVDVLKTESFFNAIVKTVLKAGNDNGVSLNVSLNTSDILLPIRKALPFCLIVNEIMSNSLRHAFDGKLTGDIQISFKKQGEYFILELNDNGKGLPKNFNWEKSNTFGFRLIQKLLIQLKGAATVTSEKGCKMMVTFPS